MDATEEQILAYAKKIKSANPSISREELQKILEAKFIYSKDILLYPKAIDNAMDWIMGLASIAEGLVSIFKDKNKEEGIRRIVAGVVIIVA